MNYVFQKNEKREKFENHKIIFDQTKFDELKSFKNKDAYI